MKPSNPISIDVEKSFLLSLLKKRGERAANFSKRQLEIFIENTIWFDWNSNEFKVIFYAQGSDIKEKKSLEENLNKILNLKATKGIKIFPPKSQLITPAKEIETHCLSYSPRRIAYDKYSDSHDFIDVMEAILRAAFMDEFIKKSLSNFYSPSEVQDLFISLPAAFSEAKFTAGYLRDDLVRAGEVVYQPHEKILKDYRSDVVAVKKEDRREDYLSISKPHQACAADMKLQGFKEFSSAPFMIEGGNVVIGNNKKGEKVMLICPSDREFDDDEKFKNGRFLEENGLVTKNDYPTFCAKVKKWGEDKGYKTAIIHRNSHYPIRQFYHADLFVGLVDGNLILRQPKDGEPQIATEETLENFKEIFGEENIKKISDRDGENLGVNFISFGNIVLMSSDVSKIFIKQLQDAGLHVVIPPCKLGLHADNGLRCHTNEVSRVLKKELPADFPKQKPVQEFEAEDLMNVDEKPESKRKRKEKPDSKITISQEERIHSTFSNLTERDSKRQKTK
jgi:hypothetical protein